MEIISQYQVSDNNRIVYLKVENFISKIIDENSKEWMDVYTRDYMNSLLDYQNVKISPQLTYIATFFEIFSALI